MQTVYLKALAALVLLACASCGGWVARGWKERSDRLESIQRDFERIAESDRAASKANRALAEQLRAPKAGVRIREIVREHPVDCAVPEPVTRGLRDALDRANAAAQ